MTSTVETCDSFETAIKQKYCSINPKKELNFLYTKNTYTARMTITNPSCKKPMMYRVRINASAQYLVTPSAGLIHPKASKNVQIVFCSKTEVKDRYNDMFLVQALPYESDEFTDEPRHILSEFAKVTGVDAQSFKLKVHFEIEKTSTPSHMKTPKTPKTPSSPNTKRIAFFQEMGSPARIQGLKGGSPMINNICSATKKSHRDYNFTTFTDKPLLSPEKMSHSQFRQSIVNRFTYGEKSTDTPPNLLEIVKAQKPDSILETKFTTEGSPTKSSNSSSSGNRMMKSDSKSIYQKKFESLEKRFNQQQEFLMKILEEKSSFLDEVNKVKFTFTSETITTNEPQPDLTKCHQVKEGGKYELWQLMTISIIFLIIGSFLKDFKS